MLEANTKGNKNINSIVSSLYLEISKNAIMKRSVMFPRHFAIKLKLASRRHRDSRRRY